MEATTGSYQLCFLYARIFLLWRLKATNATLSSTTRNCGSALPTGCTCILRFCNSCIVAYMQLKSPLYRRGWLIRISERHWCQSQVEVAPARRSEVSTSPRRATSAPVERRVQSTPPNTKTPQIITRLPRAPLSKYLSSDKIFFLASFLARKSTRTKTLILKTYDIGSESALTPFKRQIGIMSRQIGG